MAAARFRRPGHRGDGRSGRDRGGAAERAARPDRRPAVPGPPAARCADPARRAPLAGRGGGRAARHHHGRREPHAAARPVPAEGGGARRGRDPRARRPGRPGPARPVRLGVPERRRHDGRPPAARRRCLRDAAGGDLVRRADEDRALPARPGSHRARPLPDDPDGRQRPACPRGLPARLRRRVPGPLGLRAHRGRVARRPGHRVQRPGPVRRVRPAAGRPGPFGRLGRLTGRSSGGCAAARSVAGTSQCPGGKFGSVRQPQLGKDASHMSLDGPL